MNIMFKDKGQDSHVAFLVYVYNFSAIPAEEVPTYIN